MRIIAGRFRRRRLLAAPGLSTRPITDRVKESLFEHMERSVHDARIADVFAGTGTLGLEALSRGARSAVFIEQDRQAFDLLEQNVAHVGASDVSFCWRTDAIRTSYRPRGIEGLFPYDLIFFDPPYRMAPAMRPGSPLYKALERLARPDVSSASSRLVLRVPEHAKFETPEIWRPDWTLDMSSMEIHLYSKLPAAPTTATMPATHDESDADATDVDTPNAGPM